MSVKLFGIVALCRQLRGVAGTARCRNPTVASPPSLSYYLGPLLARASASGLRPAPPALEPRRFPLAARPQRCSAISAASVVASRQASFARSIPVAGSRADADKQQVNQVHCRLQSPHAAGALAASVSPAGSRPQWPRSAWRASSWRTFRCRGPRLVSRSACGASQTSCTLPMLDVHGLVSPP
jgi:hypothetical protein